MIEAFMAAEPARFPMIAENNAFFHKEAESIQQGGSEYVFSKEYLGIYWPADEFIFVKLTADGTFDAFYAEAGRLLAETLNARHGSLPMDVIDEAVRLNHALVNQPFAASNTSVRAPASAASWAMPEPIVPAPTTPMVEATGPDDASTALTLPWARAR